MHVLRLCVGSIEGGFAGLSPVGISLRYPVAPDRPAVGGYPVFLSVERHVVDALIAPKIADVFLGGEIDDAHAVGVSSVAPHVQVAVGVRKTAVGVARDGKVEVPHILSVALSEDPDLVVGPPEGVDVVLVTADPSGGGTHVERPLLGTAHVRPFVYPVISPVRSVIGPVQVSPYLHNVARTGVEVPQVVPVDVIPVDGGSGPGGIPVFVVFWTESPAVRARIDGFGASVLDGKDGLARPEICLSLVGVDGTCCF